MHFIWLAIVFGVTMVWYKKSGEGICVHIEDVKFGSLNKETKKQLKEINNYLYDFKRSDMGMQEIAKQVDHINFIIKESNKGLDKTNKLMMEKLEEEVEELRRLISKNEDDRLKRIDKNS